MKSLGESRSEALRAYRTRWEGSIWGSTATPVSIDPCVLVSGNETIFEGPEIEGALSRRRRQTQGGGRKDLLCVGAHHKTLAQEASREWGCGAKSDPRQTPQEG